MNGIEPDVCMFFDSWGPQAFRGTDSSGPDSTYLAMVLGGSASYWINPTGRI